MNIEAENLRISKLREYLIEIVNKIVNDDEFQINIDMLDNDINNYSIDKIPTNAEFEKWITGVEIHKDLYSFRSRKGYSQDTINNLLNIGFFEIFEKIIRNNNENHILPNIDDIQAIECTNVGTLIYADTNTAEFEIQIQIKYIVK